MSDFPITEVIIIFVLFIANGVFAGSEIAVVSARRGRIQQKADAGNRGARQTLYLMEHTDRFLATVQVGITLIGTLAAAFGGASIGEWLAQWLHTIPPLAPYADSIGLGIVVVLITYFSLILGELVPKRLSLQSAEAIAIWVAPMMVTLSVIARPVVAILTVSTNAVLRLLGRHKTVENQITEEDIVYLAREGAVSGTVESREEDFINRVFRFRDRDVSEVLIPRTEITAIEVNTSLSEVIETFLTSGYTRLPLYEGSLDNIIGVLYAKDLLRQYNKPDNTSIDLRAMARQAFFIPSSQHVDDLLNTFRSQGIHMAIVIDEYSQVTGLVTLEDILEELVGEIQDEYDQPEDQAIIQREDGSWLIDAMIDYEIVCEKVGMEKPADDSSHYHTLAGMILEQTGHIPNVGETFTTGDFLVEIVDMDGRRIDKVLVKRKEEASTTA